MKRIRLERKAKDVYGDKVVCCGMCGDAIYFSDERRWESNDTNERIAGICFMSENGDPVEAFDLCDNCIGKLYSKLIY